MVFSQFLSPMGTEFLSDFWDIWVAKETDLGRFGALLRPPEFFEVGKGTGFLTSILQDQAGGGGRLKNKGGRLKIFLTTRLNLPGNPAKISTKLVTWFKNAISLKIGQKPGFSAKCPILTQKQAPKRLKKTREATGVP